ncbi:MAG: hypothetical protein ACREOF_19820 [Gemmatimonadales bacterium]
MSSDELSLTAPADLAGAVLLAPVRLPSGPLPKGTRLDDVSAGRLIAAARSGDMPHALRVAWPEPGDVHEDEAAGRLARAVGGGGVELRPPRQSRIDLAATWDGVLQVLAEALRRLNAIDPLEVFTVFHGQAVMRGQVVASVKVAPHLVPAATLSAGERIAREEGPLVEVRPYRPHDVAAIAMETISAEALDRFERGARAKLEALGSRFAGATVIADDDPRVAETKVGAALDELAGRRAMRLLLVGGVSAGDPLSPFWGALAARGGTVIRRGVPAHPGSMIWIAGLGETQLLGLPTCGMFSLATAADLVLPRLLTGERLTAESLADMGHGGLLTRDMRFRFPAYARDLGAPDG